MSEQNFSDYERFQLKVANALARWQAVEWNLQLLFVAVIESPDARWSTAAYNAVVSTRGKIDMLHEVLLYRLPPNDSAAELDLGKQWNTLKDKILRYSRRRNNLVHWTFIGTYTEAKGTYTYISAPFGDARKGLTDKQLTGTDLDQMAADFVSLQAEIGSFHNLAVPLLSSPQKFP